ncbi:hypothetical protein KAR91_61995 [Candidatus Pacearchaeota archaeon]|nr:hypothetical protein [Candidatus Pacearchaeota archaeon]
MVIEKQEITLTLNRLELEKLYDSLHYHYTRKASLRKAGQSIFWDNEPKEKELLLLLGGLLGLYNIPAEIERSIISWAAGEGDGMEV